MKDYSMNLNERKDFILGYEIKDGNMIVKFAKGEPWPMTYNEVNEKIVLDKMKEQVSSVNEKKLKDNCSVYLLATYLGFGGVLILIIAGIIYPELKIMSYLSSLCLSIPSISFFSGYIKEKSKLKDYYKNRRFLEIEEKLNSNVRKNNALTNVSNKTKNAIKDFPEDRPVFNINSFNYVPFKDLEQIVDNADRNDRFGFKYDTISKPKTKVRKIEEDKS